MDRYVVKRLSIRQIFIVFDKDKSRIVCSCFKEEDATMIAQALNICN